MRLIQFTTDVGNDIRTTAMHYTPQYIDDSSVFERVKTIFSTPPTGKKPLCPHIG